MLELLEKLDFANLMIASVVVSVIASAMHVYFPNFFLDNKRKKINVLIIAVLITFLNLVGFVQATHIIVADYIVKFLFTWAFALLFYQIMGTWFVNKLFEAIKKKFE